MSLDLHLEQLQPVSVFDMNLTHNLNSMAQEAGLYECLWRAPENGFLKAHQLVPLLEAGIESMKAEPDRFKAHNGPNGWGTYDGFLETCERLLEGCQEYPDADISTSR